MLNRLLVDVSLISQLHRCLTIITTPYNLFSWGTEYHIYDDPAFILRQEFLKRKMEGSLPGTMVCLLHTDVLLHPNGLVEQNRHQPSTQSRRVRDGFGVTLCQPEQLESGHLTALAARRMEDFASLSCGQREQIAFSYFPLQLKLRMCKSIFQILICGLPQPLVFLRKSCIIRLNSGLQYSSLTLFLADMFLHSKTTIRGTIVTLKQKKKQHEL